MRLRVIRYKNKGVKDLIRDAHRKIMVVFCSSVWGPLNRTWYGLRYRSVADPGKTIYIQPKEITAYSWAFLYENFSFRGQIASGNWDTKCWPVERLKETPKYMGIEERFQKGMEWTETSLFEKYRSMLEQNRNVMQKNNIHDVEKYYTENIDPLYENIRENGILPASDKNPHITPLYVYIGRDGEFIYTGEGNHRLAIAHLLNLKNIPARVWKRHTLWQKKREILLNTPLSEVPRELRKFASHPDMFNRFVPQNVNSANHYSVTEELVPE